MDTLILSDFESNLSYSGLHHSWGIKGNERALSIFCQTKKYLTIIFHPDPELATYHKINKSFINGLNINVL
jgi:hypothetical protein